MPTSVSAWFSPLTPKSLRWSRMLRVEGGGGGCGTHENGFHEGFNMAVGHTAVRQGKNFLDEDPWDESMCLGRDCWDQELCTVSEEGNLQTLQGQGLRCSVLLPTPTYPCSPPWAHIPPFTGCGEPAKPGSGSVLPGLVPTEHLKCG